MAEDGGKLRAIEEPESALDRNRDPTEPKDVDWGELHTRVKNRDSAMLKDYDDEVDTLLVFAGLFSAILTAFIVDVYKDIKPQSDDISAQTLQQILRHLQGDTQTSIPAVKAHPSPTIIVVLCLWFVGLMLSLLAALFCIFMKQWLHAYSKWTDQNSFQQGLVLRGFYQASLQQWHIPDIFAALGVLLQLALVLFVVGLVGYLWTLSFIVSPFVTALAAVMVALSISTIILPVFNEECPYKFPLAYVLLKFWKQGAHRDWAERDLPIAQQKFNDGSTVGRAANQTALLLDVFPELLEEALINVLHPDLCARAVEIIRDRIRQLSPTLTQLLTETLTSSVLFNAHTAALTSLSHPPTQHMTQRRRPSRGSQLASLPRLNDLERLYCLWKIVLCSMDRPPSAILSAIRHLADTISVELSVAEKHHVPLLVDLLPQCGDLCQQGELTSSESVKIALVVDDWAKSSSNRSTVFTALRTLFHATRNIPPSVMHSYTTTGLSPLTPYLPLLERLQARTSEAAELLNVPSQGNYDPKRTDLPLLVQQSTSLYHAMADRHADFLCTHRKGFRAETSAKDEPWVVVFAADSRTLYVGTDESAAWAINLETHAINPLTPSKLPSGSYFQFSNFSRDGRFLIWGSREGPMLLCDSTAGTHSLLSELGQGMRSRPIAVSWDDGHVLIGSELSAAVLLNAQTREVVMSFEGHSKRFLRAAFAPPPARLVATSSFDNTVKVWDVDQGTCLATFSEVGQAVNGVAWSPDGSMLAISSADTIRIFDWGTQELQVTLEGHSKLVTSVAFSPSGELLASSANDKTVRVWSIDKRAAIAVLAGPSTDVNSVEFSPDGSFLACAADDSIWIWKINPSSIYRVKPPPEHPHEHPRDRWRRVGRLVGKMQNVARQFMPRAPAE